MLFRSRCLPAAAVLAVALAGPGAEGAAAQDGFLFKPPVASLELKVGRAMYAADSDLFQSITSDLTLRKQDFAAFSVGADLALVAADPLDIVIGVGYNRSRNPSEFRDFVDQDDLPIRQVTEVSHVPLTAGLRVYPLSRGASIGQHAWIPARFTPFVGGGAGITFYKFRQQGDFVDQQDLSIFTDELEAASTAFLAYGEAGGTYWVSQRLGFNGAARYTFGEATMDDDFQGSTLDLRGLHGSAGLAIRF